MLLEVAGYRNCRSTTDPRETVELYKSFQPDLLLLDLYMPKMDGYEVMKELREVIPGNTYFPILVLTSDDSSAERQKALEAGATDFLAKPLNHIEVQLRIRNLLETRDG